MEFSGLTGLPQICSYFKGPNVVFDNGVGNFQTNLETQFNFNYFKFTLDCVPYSVLLKVDQVNCEGAAARPPPRVRYSVGRVSESDGDWGPGWGRDRRCRGRERNYLHGKRHRRKQDTPPPSYALLRPSAASVRPSAFVRVIPLICTFFFELAQAYVLRRRRRRRLYCRRPRRSTSRRQLRCGRRPRRHRHIRL